MGVDLINTCIKKKILNYKNLIENTIFYLV